MIILRDTNNDFDLVSNSLSDEHINKILKLELSDDNYFIIFECDSYLENIYKLLGFKPMDSSAVSTMHFILYMTSNSHIFENPDIKDKLELFISTDPYSSFMYSTTIIQKRFPIGEPTMKSDTHIWEAYNALIKNGKLSSDGLAGLDGLSGWYKYTRVLPSVKY